MDQCGSRHHPAPDDKERRIRPHEERLQKQIMPEAPVLDISEVKPDRHGSLTPDEEDDEEASRHDGRRQ